LLTCGVFLFMRYVVGFHFVLKIIGYKQKSAPVYFYVGVGLLMVFSQDPTFGPDDLSILVM
jgi:hypothetical protein